MPERTGRAADVVYVGFLLGHGGDALQMLALANGIAQQGARVKLIVPAVENSLTLKERCDRLGIECLRTDLLTADMAGSRQRFRSLVRLFRSLDAPIVHFHSGNSCLPRATLLALELLRFRPAFVTLQSPYETIVPGSSRARFWAVMARRRFQAVVSPSDHGTRFQMRCGIPAQHAVTIRNSIDLRGFKAGDPRLPRQQLGLGPEVPIILFCSRIDGQKRPVDAVHAFANVAQEFPSAVLVFVGVGEEESAVSREADRLGVGDRVRLVGYQTNIPDWLAAATVWILPTERENFSVAVLEALAAGCPILATSCPGNDEILVDEENALTFPVGNLDAATKGLRRLLSDEPLRVALGDGARSSAQSYSVEAMAQEYRTLYSRHPLAPRTLLP